MPIEFRCTQCRRLLRTQDSSAGKQAKCPECGAVLVVPMPEAGSTNLPPLPEGGGGASPFGPQQAAASPFGPSQPPRADGSQNPYQSPADYLPGPMPVGQTGVIAPTRIDIGDIFSRTWAILKSQYGLTLAVFVIVWLLGVVVNMGTNAVSVALQAARAEPIVQLLSSVLVMIGYWLFYAWLNAGAAICYLKIARGQPTSLGEIFSGGPYLLRIVGASLLIGLINLLIAGISVLVGGPLGALMAANAEPAARVVTMISLSFLVAAVPLAIVSIGLSQFYYLILEQNLGVFDSLSLSWNITRGNRLMVFAIGAVVMVLGALITVLTCGLGLLFLVMPFVSLLFPVIYLAMTGQPTADQLHQLVWD